jgi:replicative DNA helicase
VSDALNPLSRVLFDADQKLAEGESAASRVWSTGFPMLDGYLGGGVRAGELTLIGGPQGLGKTTWALQVLRNIAVAGGTAIYFSFEHDSITVMEKLVALEAGEVAGLEGVTLARVRETLQTARANAGDLEQRMSRLPGGAEALAAVRSYADRLLVHRSNGSTTDLAEISTTISRARAESGDSPVVVVDYLQKVPVPGWEAPEEERVTTVVEGLKDLALELEVPILAIVAADKEGIAEGKRLRVSNLRGSSALAYEADVVLILNDKFDIVARHHLVYDTTNAERFRDWIVITIEKNRGGLDRIDLEFRKRLEQSRFEAGGQAVVEQLVDERVFVE